MKKNHITLLLALLLAVGKIHAQTTPNGYTSNFRFRMWAQGANPSADSLNANWKDLDHQIYKRGWILGNSKVYPTVAGWKTYFRELAGDTAFGGRLVNVAGSLFVRDTIVSGSFNGVGTNLSLLSGGNIIPGTVIASKLTQSSMGVSFDLVFSASDYRTVNWTAGTLKTAGGGVYAISSGTTGAMTAQTYIYFNYDSSTTVLKYTTDWDVVKEHGILMCVAKPSSNTDERAFYVPKVGFLGVNGDNIAANSIKANQIAGNAVTAAKISSISLSTISAAVDSLSAIVANLGRVTAGQMVIGNTNKIWLNDGLDGALNIGGSTKASAPFQVTASGNATIKTSTGSKRTELRASDNELEFFEGGISRARIGSNIDGVGTAGVGAIDAVFEIINSSVTSQNRFYADRTILETVNSSTFQPSTMVAVDVNFAQTASRNSTTIYGQRVVANSYNVLSNETSYAGSFTAIARGTGVGYGIYATAGGGATNWAGYFDAGNVKVVNNLYAGNYFTGTTAGYLIPAGVIVMWSGSIVSIPSGWHLCDGTSGTPDLRDRFIVGAGSTYSVAATGGEAMHTLTTSEMPSHTHTATVTDPGHTHSVGTVGSASVSGYSPYASGAGFYHTTVTTGSGTTGVTVSNGNTGGGAAHENRPPYYALAYIMKL